MVFRKEILKKPILQSFKIILLFLSTIFLLNLNAILNPAWAQLDRDEGNVAIIEYNGTNYDDLLPGGDWNYAPREWVADRFYETHGDFYDFLCIFTNFDFQMLKGESAFYLSVKNDVSGIGQNYFNNTALFGSGGRLQGYIDMWSLQRQVTNPDDPIFPTTLGYLAHEVNHRWGSFVKFKDGSGQISDAVLITRS